jgi:hypothetical protein
MKRCLDGRFFFDYLEPWSSVSTIGQIKGSIHSQKRDKIPESIEACPCQEYRDTDTGELCFLP